MVKIGNVQRLMCLGIKDSGLFPHRDLAWNYALIGAALHDALDRQLIAVDRYGAVHVPDASGDVAYDSDLLERLASRVAEKPGKPVHYWATKLSRGTLRYVAADLQAAGLVTVTARSGIAAAVQGPRYEICDEGLVDEWAQQVADVVGGAIEDANVRRLAAWVGWIVRSRTLLSRKRHLARTCPRLCSTQVDSAALVALATRQLDDDAIFGDIHAAHTAAVSTIAGAAAASGIIAVG